MKIKKLAVIILVGCFFFNGCAEAGSVVEKGKDTRQTYLGEKPNQKKQDETLTLPGDNPEDYQDVADGSEVAEEGEQSSYILENLMEDPVYTGIKAEGKEIFEILFASATDNPETSLTVAINTLGKKLGSDLFADGTGIGAKTIVLMGRTTCPACLEMMQKIVPAAKGKYNLKYIYYRDTQEDIRSYVDQNGLEADIEDFITMEDLTISGDDLVSSLRLVAVPTLLFFDDTEKINYVASGYFDVSKLDDYADSAFNGYGSDKIKLYDYLE